jgi:hypothetical protein
MKHGTFTLWARVFVLVCAVSFLTGCPTEPGRAGDDGNFITVEVTAGETKYFSLRTGAAVDEAQKSTANWDIAFHRKTDLFRLIFTNGGDTAGASGLSSGGQCKVYYTDKTDFASVSLGDKKVFSAAGSDYDEDTLVWVAAMGPKQEVCLNVMTYVGYGEGEDGTNAKPFADYQYNQKQFYTSADMGVYRQTDQVYIITHADGVTHSKIQINYEYDSASLSDVYMVRYAECN